MVAQALPTLGLEARPGPPDSDFRLPVVDGVHNSTAIPLTSHTEQGVGELAGAHQDHPVGGPQWASLLRPVCLHVSLQVDELAEGLLTPEASVLVMVVDLAHVRPQTVLLCEGLVTQVTLLFSRMAGAWGWIGHCGLG